MGMVKIDIIVMILVKENCMFLVVLFLLNTLYLTLFCSGSLITKSYKLTYNAPFGIYDNVSNDCNFEIFMNDTTYTHNIDIHGVPTVS